MHLLILNEYVETSIGALNGTPSSCMEIQSPQSPYDAYMPMSPAGAMMSGNGSVKSGGKLPVSHSRNSSLIEDHEGYVPMIPGGHSHSCSTAGSTTGLDEAYLDMDFARQLNLSNDDMRRMSPASSESVQSGTPSSEYPLEKVSSYLQSDDFEDGSISMRPARAYSVGSRSDTSATFKNRVGKNRLEAVQETFRTRAMSVGSKQPPRKIINQSSSNASSLPSGTSSTSLSSSWSGSTGRWIPKFPIPNGQNYPLPITPQIQHEAQESGDSDLMELDFSHNNKQKSRKRSLPGPGGNQNGNLSSSSSTGSAQKISPCARAVVGSDTPPSIVETPDTPKSSSFSANMSGSGSASPRYATSAPISIERRGNNNHDCGGYLDSGNSILTRMTGLDIKKLKELDDDGAYLDMDLTNKMISSGGLSSLSNIGSSNSSNKISNDKLKSTPVTESLSKKPYLNYSSSSGQRDVTSNSIPLKSTSSSSKPVVVKANENIATVKCNFANAHSNSNCSSNEPPGPKSGLSRSLSSSSNISTTSNNSNSSSTSCISVKSQAPLSPNERSVPLTLNLSSSTSTSSSTSSGATGTTPTAAVVTTPTCSSRYLHLIEESPEKQGSHPIFIPLQTSQSNVFTKPSKKATSKEDDHVTYSSVQPLSPIKRNFSYPSELYMPNSSSTTSTLPQPTSCGKQSQSSTSNFSPVTSGTTNIIGGLTYAQVEFGVPKLNNTDAIKRN